MTEKEWYALRDCDHAHCPYEHENPQPYMHYDDLICGYCAHVYGERTVMIPCAPPLCEDAIG